MQLAALNVPGWFSQKECETLYLLASITNGPILEIGHYCGRSTSCICQALKDNEKLDIFTSYDIPFTCSEDFTKFYTGIHGLFGDDFIPAGYKDIFAKKLTPTKVASDNLKSLGLRNYVNLRPANFKTDTLSNHYKLIFCDAMHNEIEIRLNLPDIIRLSAPNCLWAFHDMTVDFIKLISEISGKNSYVIVDSLGVIQRK